MLMEARLLDERREGIAEGKDVALLKAKLLVLQKAKLKKTRYC